MPKKLGDLLTSVLIDSYSLDIRIDFETCLVDGTASIKFSSLESSFELDAQDMEIKEIKCDGRAIPFEYDKAKALLKIPTLPRSKDGSLIIEYKKQIPEKASTGVFKSNYGSGYFIATDFEPDRARTFFPCKDNPSWKAVFNVSVTTRKDLKVISNTSIKQVEDLLDGKLRKTTFNQTPKMSTYLLFVGVGNFAEKNVTVPGSTRKVIMATRPEVSEKCDFSLEIASTVLKESEEYFDAPYPLDKLHLIALSEYNGAMENWGAITGAELVLVLDSKSSSAFDLRNGGIVTAHEIQHQWFGDLVTMKWWDDIWLNEGFATFMSYKIINRLHPEWNMWSEFLMRFGFDAMRIDELKSTHPVEVKMKNASEMNEVFDFISYGKGASVLRMLESFLGEEAFRSGIRRYIKRFSYSNAASNDLWNELEKASRQPVLDMMEHWTKRSGIPLVSVENRGGKKLVLRQKRFYLNKLKEEDATPRPKELWPIPITMRINGKRVDLLFSDETQEVQVPGGGLTELKINLTETGFYCVKYDRSTYDLIEKQFPSFGGLDKAGIMNDLFQLLLSEEVEGVDKNLYFKFVSLCSKEEDYALVRTVLRQLELLGGIAEDSYEIREASLKFLKAQIDRIGISSKEGEDSNDKILREYLSIQLASLDQEFGREMSAKFPEYASLPPEVREAIAVGYAKTEGMKAFDVLMEMLKKSESEVDRGKIYGGLTHLEDGKLVQKVIDFSASGQVPRTDVFWALLGAAYNPSHRRVAWNWVKNNFDRFWDLLGSTLFILNLLQYVIPRCAIEDEVDARSFFSGERLDKGKTSFEQDLELLHAYARVRKTLSK